LAEIGRMFSLIGLASTTTFTLAIVKATQVVSRLRKMFQSDILYVIVEFPTIANWWPTIQIQRKIEQRETRSLLSCRRDIRGRSKVA
jgi:hypothetical protein